MFIIIHSGIKVDYIRSIYLARKAFMSQMQRQVGKLCLIRCLMLMREMGCSSILNPQIKVLQQ
jgi:hypothetical protein